MSYLSRFEVMLREGRFGDVDRELDAIEPMALEPVDTLSILNITSFAKADLTRRDAFVERAVIALYVQVGKARADKLLERRR